jgi:hypothetical protein
MRACAASASDTTRGHAYSYRSENAMFPTRFHTQNADSSDMVKPSATGAYGTPPPGVWPTREPNDAGMRVAPPYAGTRGDVDESSGANHSTALMGPGSHERDCAMNAQPLCCTPTVRSLRYVDPLYAHVSGRKRYGEWPEPAPTSGRPTPSFSNHVPSKCVRMSVTTSVSASLCAAGTKSGMELDRL